MKSGYQPKGSVNLFNPHRGGSAVPRLGHKHEDDDEDNFILSNLFNQNKSATDNRIYFYDEVNSLTALMLNKQLADKSNELFAQSVKYNIEVIPLYLHINSPGGEIFGALSILDNMTDCKVPVVSLIEGVCASAASFISVCASHRQMRQHSYVLIHELSAGHYGKYSDSKVHQENLDNFMKVIKGIYKEKTKMPEKILNEILRKDLFLDSKTCLKYKIVDEII